MVSKENKKERLIRCFSAVIIIFVFLLLLTVQSQAQKNGKIDFLFSPKNMKAHSLDDLRNFDIANSGAVILLTKNNLFDVGGKRFILSKKDNGLQNFCCASDGTIFTISGNTLGCLSAGTIEKLITLPSSGMKITDGGKGRIYIYGGDTEPNKALYLIEKEKGYKKICDMPRKILSLAANGDTIYFSVANDIYEIKFGGKFRLLCRVPGPEISSLAVDNKTGVIYFTAGNALYAKSAENITFIAENFGEILKFSNEALYVLRPASGTLIRISGLNF